MTKIKNIVPQDCPPEGEPADFSMTVDGIGRVVKDPFYVTYIIDAAINNVIKDMIVDDTDSQIHPLWKQEEQLEYAHGQVLHAQFGIYDQKEMIGFVESQYQGAITKLENAIKDRMHNEKPDFESKPIPQYLFDMMAETIRCHTIFDQIR